MLFFNRKSDVGYIAIFIECQNTVKALSALSNREILIIFLAAYDRTGMETMLHIKTNVCKSVFQMSYLSFN